MDVEGAIRRAGIRIRYHGWRKGAYKWRKGDKFPGYNLRDAIVGKTGGPGTPVEQDAIRLLEEMIGEPIDDWNDAQAHSLTVLALLRDAEGRLGVIRDSKGNVSAPEAAEGDGPFGD